MSNITPTPFPTSAAPGLPRDVLAAVVNSASPAAQDFTLPRQGIYLATLTVTAKTSTNRLVGLYLIKWVSDSGFFVRGTDLLGSTDQSGGEITGITVSDPTTTGVVTVSVTHLSGATAVQVNYQIALREMGSATDQYAV